MHQSVKSLTTTMAKTLPHSDVRLDDLFASAVGNDPNVKNAVYANGRMQGRVFVEVSYTGSDPTTTKDDLKKYVEENVQILVSTSAGTLVPCTWERSMESNGYKHDLFQDTAVTMDGYNARSDLKYVRIPIYHTVPINAAGEYHWVARANETTTNIKTAVAVACNDFSISASNFDFRKVARDTTHSVTYYLQALKYQKNNTLPAPLQLVKCIDGNKGAEEDWGGAIGKCWVYHHYIPSIAVLKYPPSTDTASSHKFSSKDVSTAWSLGIPLVAPDSTEGWSQTFTIEEIKVEDNFGNRIVFDIYFTTELVSVKNPKVAL